MSVKIPIFTIQIKDVAVIDQIKSHPELVISQVVNQYLRDYFGLEEKKEGK